MIHKLSTLVDLHHILHPKQLNEKHDRDQPTFFRRIAGIVLLALSIPFTLGIATGLYVYWAHRKVVHIKEQDRKDLDLRVVKIFGEIHGEVAGLEEKPERATFEATLKALQRGDKKVMMTKVGEFGEETLTKDMKKALIATAIDYDRIDALNELWTSFRSVYIPLHRAKSPEMVAMIVGKAKDKNVCINRDHGDGNTALHHQQNLEVVKALTEQGADYKRNNEGKMPLHLCTDPKIAQHLIEHFGKGILEEKDNEDEGRTSFPFFTAPQGGNTALHLQQNLAVVKVLTSKGAEYKPNSKGERPLHLCTDPKIAEHLIEHFGKGILEEKDYEGKTAFLTAPPAVKRVLFEKGADVKAKDRWSRTVLEYFSDELFNDDPELINTIIKKFDDKCSINFLEYFIDKPTFEDSKDELDDLFKGSECNYGVGYSGLILPCKEETNFPCYLVNYESTEEKDEKKFKEFIKQLISKNECKQLTDNIYSYKLKKNSREVLFHVSGWKMTPM